MNFLVIKKFRNLVSVGAASVISLILNSQLSFAAPQVPSEINLQYDSSSLQSILISGIISKPLHLETVTSWKFWNTYLELRDRKGSLASYEISGQPSGKFKIQVKDHRLISVGGVEGGENFRFSKRLPSYLVFDLLNKPLAHGYKFTEGEIRFYKPNNSSRSTNVLVAKISLPNDIGPDATISIFDSKLAGHTAFKYIMTAFAEGLLREHDAHLQPSDLVTKSLIGAAGIFVGAAIGAGIYYMRSSSPPPATEITLAEAPEPEYNINNNINKFRSPQGGPVFSFNGKTETEKKKPPVAQKEGETEENETEIKSDNRIPVGAIGQRNFFSVQQTCHIKNVCGINAANHLLREYFAPHLKPSGIARLNRANKDRATALLRERTAIQKSKMRLKPDATESDKKIESDKNQRVRNIDRELALMDAAKPFSTAFLNYLRVLNKREEYVGRDMDAHFPTNQALEEMSAQVIFSLQKRAMIFGGDDVELGIGEKQISAGEFVSKAIELIDPQQKLGFYIGSYTRVRNQALGNITVAIQEQLSSAVRPNVPETKDEKVFQNWIDEYFSLQKAKEGEVFRDDRDNKRHPYSSRTLLIAKSKPPEHLIVEINHNSHGTSDTQAIESDFTKNIRVPFYIVDEKADLKDSIRNISQEASHPDLAPPKIDQEMEAVVVVIKTGNVEGGHYSAYIKREGVWVLCDDDAITVYPDAEGQKVAIQNISEKATLVLYKKVNPAS